MSVKTAMTAIADAIRAKTGKTDELTLDQMAAEIAGIQAGSGGGDAPSGEIVVIPKTEFAITSDYTPYAGIEIPDDINNGVIYDVYFDGRLYNHAKLSLEGVYGNPLWYMGADDGTPFLLIAGEGVYAYTGTHTIRIIKSL